uniref:Uncharacterized protein n=1 Tax=Romanomermis culicivorax TaxID=13658 RepID=A0A915I6Y5_ROMCU
MEQRKKSFLVAVDNLSTCKRYLYVTFSSKIKVKAPNLIGLPYTGHTLVGVSKLVVENPHNSKKCYLYNGLWCQNFLQFQSTQ